MRITFRHHKGILNESMKTKREFKSMDFFLEYLVKYHEDFDCKKKDITFNYYCDYDRRIGWKNIFLVMIKKIPMGYMTFDEIEKIKR